MGRLSAQVQMYVGIALIAVVALAVTFLAIVPLFQEAATVDDQIVAEEQSLVTAQALLARRQSAKAQAAANDVELMNIANQIPDSPQLPSVVIELQDAANSAGVKLEAIAPSELNAATDDAGQPALYSVVPVNLIVRGDWVDLIDYVGRISKLKRGLRVVDTSFTYVEPTDMERAYVEASVSLEVYVMEAASDGATATTATQRQ